MSNKKSLLTENTIRRFMKLASIGGLSENFIDSKEKIEEEEEELEEGASDAGLASQGPNNSQGSTQTTQSHELKPLSEEEDELKEEFPGEEPAEDLPPVDALDAPGEEDLDADPAPAEGGEELAQEVAVAVADALQSVLGVEVSVSGEGEEAPMDEEPPVDMPMDDEADMGAPPEEEPAMRDMYEAEKTPSFDKDAVVAEVTRRVAQKLKDRSRKERVAEELAERIFNRLNQKKS